MKKPLAKNKHRRTAPDSAPDSTPDSTPDSAPDSAPEGPPMKKTALLAVMAFLGIGIAAAVYLVMVKLRGQYEIGYVAGCNVGGNFDCGAVQGHSSSLVLGIPIAVWSIPTYLSLIALAWIGMGRRGPDGRLQATKPGESAVDIIILVTAASMVYAMYLSYLQTAVIGARCIVCYGMYACQLGALISAVWARPGGFKAPKGFVGSLKNGVSTIFSGASPVPVAAVVFGLGLAGGIIWFNAERATQYQRGGEKALAMAAENLAAGDYDKAQLLLNELASRNNSFRTAAERLAEQVIEAQFASEPTGLATAPAQPPSDVESPATVQPAVAAAPPTTNPTPAPTTPAKAPPSPAQPAKAQPAAAPASGFGPFDINAVRCSGKRSDNGWSNCQVPITDDDFVWGNPKAKVTIMEFADFECGYCRMLSSNLKRVKEKYKDQLRFVFKMYPMDGACNRRMGGERMHPDACGAAKAGYCAGKQGKFWEAHDKLFAMQKNNQPEKVVGYMKELGLDMAAWQACFDSQAPLNRINNDVSTAGRAGIYGTPRMYINGRLVSGAATPAILEYYIKHALKNPQMGQPQAPRAPVKVDTSTPMVAVKTQGGTHFIDRFEAAIDQEGRAVSLPKVQPAQASWYQAEDACKKAGKRLCTEEEWASACTGEPAIDNNNNHWFNDDEIEGSRYPYGPFYEAGYCHDGQKTLEGDPIPTGSKSRCVTAAGVFDLTGNIAEWIENDEQRASMVGGNFGSGEGAACNRRGTMFGPGIRNNTTGFRCCADSMVANQTTDPAKLRKNSAGLIGAELPRFVLKTTTGETLDSKTLRGKVTYVTFFASWCGSCKRELPELNGWLEELGPKGFQVIAIGVDRNGNQSKSFIEKYSPKYTVALDPDSKAMTEFNIAAMPTSFVVDKKGVVRRRIVGFKKEEVPALKAFVQTLF